MLEVGEGAGGLEFLVHQHLVVRRLDLVEHRRQLFVFGGNQLHRLLGQMRILGQHGGNGLADVMHLVERQDRLVVERRPVVRIGDDGLDVLAGIDGENARYVARSAHIDGFDAPMRHRAAEELADQHAGQAHGVGIFGAPAYLRACLQSR